MGSGLSDTEKRVLGFGITGLGAFAPEIEDFIKGPERKEKAFRDRQEAEARNLIQETTERLEKTATDSAQESRKAFELRQKNKADRLQSELSRRGLVGSPVEGAAIASQQQATARASDRLGVELAKLKLDASKQAQSFRAQSLLNMNQQKSAQGRIKSFGEQAGEAAFSLGGSLVRRGAEAGITAAFRVPVA